MKRYDYLQLSVSQGHVFCAKRTDATHIWAQHFRQTRQLECPLRESLTLLSNISWCSKRTVRHIFNLEEEEKEEEEEGEEEEKVAIFKHCELLCVRQFQ